MAKDDPRRKSLGWHQISAANRVLLPSIPMLHLTIGLTLLLQDPTRTMMPVYQGHRDVVDGDLRWWAALFLGVAAYQTWAICVRRRYCLVRSIILGAWVAVFWGALLLITAVKDDRVSFTLSVWVLWWLAAHLASAKSLIEGERS